ncbi:hypothetical protein CKY47_02780 [Saccharothrix yanglingensis]|uniref:Tetratricopeptide repeat protein n=1 Tax=Saccharothrix yanglingensis TaxID=659496 RepID=A0ABU0WT46_9PSEU|nr:hypothetical protein [Saccharothrix yanglingensis]
MVAVTAAGKRGSGYVVGPHLVLTSAHVVGHKGATVRVFRPGGSDTHEGVVVWCGTSAGRDDAALVRIDSRSWLPPSGKDVVWGRVVTELPGLKCEVRGVPERAQRPGEPVDTGQLSGTLNPDDLRITNRHVMAVQGHRPDEGGSPWGGLSGGALFSEGLLIGVVMADEADSGHTRLVAVPSYVLHHDEGFRTVLADHGGGAAGLRPVEFARLAEPPLPLPALLPSPGWLLHPALEVVRFRGRRGELDRLGAWAAVEGFGACLVHGPGGQGKTRLARQFGQELGGGWAVVWLDHRRAEDDLAVIADAAVPTLVVVDYAETRTGQVEALVRAAADHDGGTPLKVLLLARTAGEWWERLRVSSGTASLLLDGSPVIALAPLESEDGGRVDAYREAVEGFSTALLRVRGLPGQAWEQIASRVSREALPGTGQLGALTLHMTALADLLDVGAPPDEPTPAGDVEDRLLDHEQRYWDQAAALPSARLDLARSTLHDAMAAAVLVGADDREQADALLCRIAGLADQQRDRRDAVVQWIASLYPGAGGIPFGAPQPDRLAERFVGRHLQARAELADRLIPGTSPEQAERLLTIYSRAAGHTVFAGLLNDGLSALCVRHIRHLGGDVITVVTQVEYPQPLLQALFQISEALDTSFDLLAALYDRLPLFSHRLADWAAQLGERLLHTSREQVQTDPDTFLPYLATSLNNQAIRLGDLGRREEALEAITEAVKVYRELVRARPDTFLPDLATSLSNQSVRLGGLGRYKEGLGAVTEAVAIRRELARARPDAFLSDLAMSLNNQSIQLGGLGRREEALGVATEAVKVYRELARARPDAFLPDLATSLSNQSIHLGGLGRREEALGVATEAVEVYRELARARPDAFLPNLAMSLNNQSIDLGGLGRREEALGVATEAVEVYRELARARPDAFLPDLAMSLNSQSVRLGGLGRYKEGLGAVTEAVAIRRELARARPDAFLPDLAMSLNNQSIHLGGLGRREEALEAITEAVKVYRELARVRPEAFLPDLAMSLNNQSGRLGEIGRREEALGVATEAVEVYRELARVRPEAFLPDLAMSLNNQSIHLGGLGRREEALEAITEAVAIRRELVQVRPQVHQKELRGSLRVLAWVNEISGETEGRSAL